MTAWRDWDWQAIAIVATIIGAAYLLGRDTASPGEVRAIVADAVSAAVAEAVAPLPTRDQIDSLRDEVDGLRDEVDGLRDGQHAQSDCLSDLYAHVRRDVAPSVGADVPACERLQSAR